MLFVQESYYNADTSESQGKSGVYETSFESRGKLFRACRKEHGRCVGKVYIDKKNGRIAASWIFQEIAIGWVFQKEEEYEDTHEPYLREVWITVHTKMPKHTTEYYYDERPVKGKG